MLLDPRVVRLHPQGCGEAVGVVDRHGQHLVLVQGEGEAQPSVAAQIELQPGIDEVRGDADRRARSLSEGTVKGKGNTRSFPFSTYS
jgi:hypothetical protein